MARTPLFARIARQARIALSAHRSGVPIREHTEQLRAALSRRSLLKGATAGAGLVLVPGLATFGQGCGSDPANGARVAVVGAGLAGLHAAYRLVQAGISVDVYEASSRTGGRTFTARGMLEGDQLAELGGELIDSDHRAMMALATEFELTLDDLVETDPSIRVDTFFFGGRVVPEAEVLADFVPVAARMAAAYEAAAASDDAYAALDAISLRAWLDDPANMATPLMRDLLDVAYTGEYGREVDEQSVLNMLELIDFETTDPFHVFGDSDERYHLHTGSESIAEALTAELGDRIRLSHRLTAMRAGGAGTTTLTFETGASTVERSYERVILALPFTTLREVEIGEGLIPEDHQQVIDEIGYGQNSKLMLQFTGRTWRTGSMAGGSAFADNGAQTLWETSRGQAGTEGILTHFAGGDGGVSLGVGTPEMQATRVLPFIEALYPGTMAAYNSRVLRMAWPDSPYQRGSYACYAPGQWAFFGLEGRQEGNLHFCGEHTSEDYQGYMEGAAESGARAATEVMTGLGMAALTAPLVAMRAHAGRGRRSRLAARHAHLSPSERRRLLAAVRR